MVASGIKAKVIHTFHWSLHLDLTPYFCYQRPCSSPAWIHVAPFHWCWTTSTQTPLFGCSNRYISPTCLPVCSDPALTLACLFSSPFRTKISKVFYNPFRDYKSCYLSSVLLKIFCWSFLISTTRMMTEPAAGCNEHSKQKNQSLSR